MGAICPSVSRGLFDRGQRAASKDKKPCPLRGGRHSSKASARLGCQSACWKTRRNKQPPDWRRHPRLGLVTVGQRKALAMWEGPWRSRAPIANGYMRCMLANRFYLGEGESLNVQV